MAGRTGTGSARKVARGVVVRTDGTWSAYQVTFTYRGVTCREVLKGLPVTTANDKYAKNLKGEIDNAIARGTFRYADFFPDSRKGRVFGQGIATLKVSALVTTWLENVKQSYPHSTYNAYAGAARFFEDTALWKMRAADLAPEHIRALFREKSISLKTVRNYLTPLKGAFEQAVADGVLPSSPVDKIKPNRLVSHDRKSTDYEPDPFTVDEITAILKVCREKRPRWAPYWQFAFFSGLRTSEQYALAWNSVDLDAGTLKVEAATVHAKEKDPKTLSSKRELSILPLALAALKEQRAWTGTWSPKVFVNPNTKRPLADYGASANCFRWLLDQAGVRYRNQYQTRHTFASQLLSGGENPYRVAAQLGHKNVEMVMRVYGKWIEQGEQELRRKFVSEFANMSSIGK